MNKICMRWIVKSEEMAIENISAFGISMWIDMKEEPPPAFMLIYVCVVCLNFVYVC